MMLNHIWSICLQILLLTLGIGVTLRGLAHGAQPGDSLLPDACNAGKAYNSCINSSRP